jgi:gluconokinase
MRRSESELLVLAMDIGTSSTRTALFDERGVRLPESFASAKYAVRYTEDGGAELAPAVLLRAAKGCLRKTLRAHGETNGTRTVPIRAIGTSGFWHSLLGLDQHGRAITPIFTWADSRAATDAARLRERFVEQKIHARTGCMLRAPYWPAKLRWFARTQPKLVSRVKLWISPADWIAHELFGTAISSRSMASGTGLYNLRIRDWDEELLEFCGVGSEQLLPLENSAPAIRGALKNATLFSAIGDGAASNLGSGADASGIVAINMGTSGAVRVVQPDRTRVRTPFGLFRHVVDDDCTLVGGAVSNAGNLHAWCLRELRLTDDHRHTERMLQRNRAANDPLTILPFWVNERAPSWPDGIGGIVSQLSQSTTAADILRAGATSVCYRLSDIFDGIESSAGRSRAVVISGGVLRSPALLRILADSLGRDLQVCTEAEASLRGAAIHALRQLGRKVPPLRRGKIIPHERNLAKQHANRRRAQNQLERQLR